MLSSEACAGDAAKSAKLDTPKVIEARSGFVFILWSLVRRIMEGANQGIFI
jgi:hypothetical protein